MRHPLYGIPFSIKDNIDINGVLTTAACPEYAYVAENDAPSELVRYSYHHFLRKGPTCNRYDVTFLVDLWSINIFLSRFSQYEPASVFPPDYLSGGSPSGSCTSVASNQVSFSLGTDTAGSGCRNMAMQ